MESNPFRKEGFPQVLRLSRNQKRSVLPMVNYLNELYHLQKCPNCNEKMSFWKKKAGNKTPVCLSDKM